MMRLTGKEQPLKPVPAYKRRQFAKLHPPLFRKKMKVKRRLNRRLHLKKIGFYRWKTTLWYAARRIREALANRQT